MWSLFFGYTASILLTVCALPQLVKTVKDGNAHGLSIYFVVTWFAGMISQLLFAVSIKQLPLILNAGITCIVVAVILYYKIFPKTYGTYYPRG